MPADKTGKSSNVGNSPVLWIILAVVILFGALIAFLVARKNNDNDDKGIAEADDPYDKEKLNESEKNDIQGGGF